MGDLAVHDERRRRVNKIGAGEGCRAGRGKLDRVRDLKAKGQSLAQVNAARTTMDFDGRYGATSGAWTTDMFVEAVYTSLKEKK